MTAWYRARQVLFLPTFIHCSHVTKLIHGFSRAHLIKELKAMITQGLALGGLFGGLSHTAASCGKHRGIHLSIDPREQRMLTAQMSALREFINNVIVSIRCQRSQGQVASSPTSLFPSGMF